MDLQEPLAGSKTRGGTTAWKALFSPEPLEWEAGSSERLAQQVVEALLSACLQAYPGLLEQLGLPGTTDQMVNTTPYQLAVQVYTRWSTEEQLFDGLGMLSSELMSEPLQGCIRFCVRAILHRFNLQLKLEYRVLFVEPGET